MAGTQKKVIVRLFDAGTVSGYLPTSGYLDSDSVSLMDAGGKSISFAISEIKWIAYVWDFNTGDTVEPERIGRLTFPARPRNEGLWVRMTFRDGVILEGISALDISFLDTIVQEKGLLVAPPDSRSNTQRIYVPRTALTSLELLGVITSAAKRKTAVKPVRESQPGLFGES